MWVYKGNMVGFNKVGTSSVSRLPMFLKTNFKYPSDKNRTFVTWKLLDVRNFFPEKILFGLMGNNERRTNPTGQDEYFSFKVLTEGS